MEDYGGLRKGDEREALGRLIEGGSLYWARSGWMNGPFPRDTEGTQIFRLHFIG